MRKLLILFFLAACLHIPLLSLGQTISLEVQDTPLESVFRLVQQQSPYRFVYASEDLAATKKVTVSLTNVPIATLLEEIFKDQAIGYNLRGQVIMISRINRPVSTGHGYGITVTGKVIDEEGKGLPSVTITMKGKIIATATDEHGNFVIRDADSVTVLLVSSVGYESIQVALQGRQYLVIQLTRMVNTLDETIIKGYYSTSRRLNTGAVSKVTAEEISRQPVNNVLAALEGRMPGVVVTQQSGVPGGGFTVLIRGQNSLRNAAADNGNLPFYIVDGVPYTSTPVNSFSTGAVIQYGNPLSFINPADIASIEVLKDADATSIYGSRGANGVILITTKKGKSGKTGVDLNVYTGAGKISRQLHLLDTRQYIAMRREAFTKDGTVPTAGTARDLFRWDTTRYTDWQQQLIGGTAHTTNAHISISGGNTQTQFLVGGAFSHESTVFPGDFSDNKGSAHFNIAHRSENEKFSLVFSGVFMTDGNNLLPLDLTSKAITLPANAPALYDSAGKLNWQSSTWDNPLSYTLKKYNIRTSNLVSNASLVYRLLPGLQLKTNLGYTQLQVNEISKSPLTSYDPAILSFVSAFATFADNSIKTWIVEPQAEYQRTLGSNKFTLLGGATLQQNTQEGQTVQGNGFSNDALLDNLQAASTITVLSASYRKYKYSSVFGRINYNRSDKYLLNLTARRDGSSRFGANHQFANFASAGGAWILSSEKFVKQIPFISFAKLRGSYGTTGSDQITDYGYLDSYTPATYTYNGNAGLIPTRLANPDYSWETNRKIDLALELGFLQDRILFSANWYKNRSSNQLVGYALPVITGQSTVQKNLPATVENSGWEFTLSTINIKTNRLRWALSANITIPENKLVDYPNIQGSPYANTYTIGQSLYAKKVYHYTGVDPLTGVYTFQDVDHDNQISFPNDLMAAKEVSQKSYGGLSNNIKYGRFELDFFIQGVSQTAWNTIYTGSLPGAMFNQPVEVLQRWQQPGDITSAERFTRNFGSAAGVAFNNLKQSDAAISDASFLRLKNVSLSYSIPARSAARLHLQNARIYIQGQNLLTITGYRGMDPEQPSVQNLPSLKLVTAGFQITL